MQAMFANTSPPRIFVAGASGFVGTAVVYALLQAGAKVTAWRQADSILALPDHKNLTQITGDAWNRGSLKGRSRGHQVVLHLIGSMRQDQVRGQSYHYTNVDTAQNTAQMTIGDGVQQYIYLSASGAPWMPRGFIQSKREAEEYIQRSGVRWCIIRAPLAYPRGQLRNPLLLFYAGMGLLPVMGRPFAHWAPLPVDVMARGIAQLALSGEGTGRIVYGYELQRRSRLLLQPQPQFETNDLTIAQQPPHNEDDDLPFGWLPPA